MNNNKNITDLGTKCCNRIDQFATSGQLTNDDLVQIIEVAGSYLNLTTRSEYARQHKISYNGAKGFRRNIKLFGATFVIDNE